MRLTVNSVSSLASLGMTSVEARDDVSGGYGRLSSTQSPSRRSVSVAANALTSDGPCPTNEASEYSASNRALASGEQHQRRARAVRVTRILLAADVVQRAAGGTL